jgi:transcription-repair coupling factor (superfamily II helicase)
MPDTHQDTANLTSSCSLVDLLGRTEGFSRAAEVLQTSSALSLQGLSGGGKSAVVAAWLQNITQPCAIITFNEERARQLADDLRGLFNDTAEDRLHRRVLLFPSTASALYDGVTPDPETVADRMLALERLCSGDPVIIVASIMSAVTLTIPGADYVANRIELEPGIECDRDLLAYQFADLGYERVDLIDDVAQYSVRGGIVDVSPPPLRYPVRIELLGNLVESIRRFEPITQRSVGEVERVGIGPAGEIILSKAAVEQALPQIKLAFRRELDILNEANKKREARHLTERMEADFHALQQLQPTAHLVHYLPYLYNERETFLDYLPADAPLIIDEPVRVKAAADQFESDVTDSHRRGIKLGRHLRLPQTACLTFDEFRAKNIADKRPIIYINMLQRQVPWDQTVPAVSLATPPTEAFGGRFELLVEGVAQWQKEGQCVLVCAQDIAKSVEILSSRGLHNVRVAEDLDDLKPGAVNVLELDLTSGFSVPEAQLVALTAKEIYGWRKLHRPEATTYKRGFSLTSLHEIDEGDYVVHINHGIGIYQGLAKQTVDDVERDYLVIAYAGEDKLYVPVTQLDRIQRYIGSEGAQVTVHSLKGSSWQTTKRKVKKSAQLLARELLKLYRKREETSGYAFEQDLPWLKELEATFQFEETPDQLHAIADVKADMETATPADRLICGDVGFGKTEVALRAAFKAVLSGKQVAVLVPTTVLCHQHFNTFRERLSRYPIEVEMLSRFRSAKQQRHIITRLKEGATDIVVGTHRLLGSDIAFADLGLLIVDEEQRFGVKQKERLKKFKASVDCITLTATPIPRTLNMALSGIREISLINDPPQGRRSIRTFVREDDDALISEAVTRELNRGGQIYYLHNRVKSIAHAASRVQRLVPQARVAVAHGQMEEVDLEAVMMAFYAEEFDVLVCTTIIENGLDVANANTLIVDDADRLGLSQLYQLRGRVGRSSRQAYAYLLYRYPERMTEQAEERLRAIEEFSQLGSGFKIALRDLEIRGAGDILGAEQSGHMSAVGLDLYCQMLADAVSTLKGENGTRAEGGATVDLPIETIIPPDYVPGERQRIELYRRLANVSTLDELKQLIKATRDRYGQVPTPVRNLVTVARTRLKCRQAHVIEIASGRDQVTVRLDPKHRLTAGELAVIEAFFVPSRRQARHGTKSILPRIVFREQQIDLGFSKKDPQALIPVLNALLDRLIDRHNAAKHIHSSPQQKLNGKIRP